MPSVQVTWPAVVVSMLATGTVFPAFSVTEPATSVELGGRMSVMTGFLVLTPEGAVASSWKQMVSPLAYTG